jgi:hypothetical protein
MFREHLFERAEAVIYRRRPIPIRVLCQALFACRPHQAVIVQLESEVSARWTTVSVPAIRPVAARGTSIFIANRKAAGSYGAHQNAMICGKIALIQCRDSSLHFEVTCLPSLFLVWPRHCTWL